MKDLLSQGPWYRIAVAALLVLGLTLRVAFVLQMPLGPLFWDEVHYDSVAGTYAEFWSGLLGGDDGSSGPTFKQAFERSLQKGEAYSATLGLVYAVTDGGRRAMLVLQALLDTLGCLLIYGLARALGGRAVGIVALALAISYESFLFTAGRLQTETLAMTLCLGGLWAATASPRTRSTAWHVAGGTMTALAMLAKPALQLLLPVFLGAIFLRQQTLSRRRALQLAAWFALGFALLVGPRLVWTHVTFGEASWKGTSSPGTHVYGGAVVENLGWKTDRQSFAYPPRGQLLRVLGDPPSRRPTESDQWRAAWRTWIFEPFGSASVVLHKFWVAWAIPYNDARQEFVTGRAVQQRIHRIVLILALMGMPVAFRSWRVGLPLIVTGFYLWATYLVVAIEVRYAIVAIPLMLCFAALALVTFSTGIARVRRGGAGRWPLAAALGTLLGTILLWLFPVSRLVDRVPWMTPEAAHASRVVAALAVMALAALAFAETLEGSRIRRAMAVLPSLLVIVLVYTVGAARANVWREWSSPLGQGTVARHEFIVPAELGRPAAAELRLDLLPNPGAGCDVIVRLDGLYRRFEGGPRREHAALVQEDYFHEVAAAQGRDREPARTWYRFRVPEGALVPGRPVRVEVAAEAPQAPGPDTGTAAAPCVTLFGDYPGVPGLFDGPSPFSPDRRADTSLYRYLATGDFRMRRRTPLEGSARSSFLDGASWSEDDLSLEAGRQFGRYRIFLTLTYPDHQVVL